MAVPSRNTLLIVALTQETAPAMRAAMESAFDGGADAVELRLDYLQDAGDQALGELMHSPPGPILVTCRSAEEGGRFAGSQADRLALLARAARLGGDWIDLELASLPDAGDFVRELDQLRDQAGPGEPRRELIFSAHDFAGPPADLAGLLRRMDEAPGAVNKIAFMAHGPEDALAALDLLRASRKPAIALAMGEHGVTSRVLARKFGAFATFASLQAGAQSAPGQPSLDEFKQIYRWDHLGGDTKVYGVIGCPIGHSMSPAIHNAAFEADGLDGVYVPLRIEPGAGPFNRFLDAVLARPRADLAGLSVTIPHKANALARVGADNVDELARRIGAINTIRFTGNADRPMEGTNTDYAAALDALVQAMGIAREDLAGRQVAMIGAGGAARALVAGLAHYGANVDVYNRTLSRAEALADEFTSARAEVAAWPIAELPGRSAEIYVNCTPIGMHPHVEGCPLPADYRWPTGATVFDTIYNPPETLLLRRARQAGCLTVSGVDMFVNQAVAQYRFWTRRAAPREVMRRVVLDRLSASR